MDRSRTTETGEDSQPVDLAGRLSHSEASEESGTGPILTTVRDALKMRFTGRTLFWVVGFRTNLAFRGLKTAADPHSSCLNYGEAVRSWLSVLRSTAFHWTGRLSSEPTFTDEHRVEHSDPVAAVPLGLVKRLIR